MKTINHFNPKKPSVGTPLGFSAVAFKLNGVDPVDNRPSTDKLHHFVQKEKKKEEKKVTCEM